MTTRSTTHAREGGLARWQWALYAGGHRDRTNLLIHALTQPIFCIGTLTALSAPFVNVWLVLIGFVTMGFAMALQGRGHRRETTPPAPFRSPLEVFTRIFLEQWFTFPRFVLTGGFARAWAEST